MVKNLPAVEESQLRSLGREDPLRREWRPTPVSLPGSPMDRGAWWAEVHGATKSRARLSDSRFHCLFPEQHAVGLCPPPPLSPETVMRMWRVCVQPLPLSVEGQLMRWMTCSGFRVSSTACSASQTREMHKLTAVSEKASVQVHKTSQCSLLDARGLDSLG